MNEARELVPLMGRFAHSWMRWLRARMEEAGVGNPTQVQLLHILHCQGALKMTDLGERLGVTPRNVTKLVDALESEGLVCRREVPGDRRAVLVELKPAGQERQRELARQGMDRVSVFFEEHLSPAEQAELARLLRKLLAGLGQDCSEHRPGPEQ
jgi:DNA-binding MarR family transcriptional regulator